jgi:tRNA nucleotidyltransferase/poly(A) polymerase
MTLFDIEVDRRTTRPLADRPLRDFTTVTATTVNACLAIYLKPDAGAAIELGAQQLQHFQTYVRALHDRLAEFCRLLIENDSVQLERRYWHELRALLPSDHQAEPFIWVSDAFSLIYKLTIALQDPKVRIPQMITNADRRFAANQLGPLLERICGRDQPGLSLWPT